MCFHARAGARLSRFMLSRKSPPGIQATNLRRISWIPFEMPDPALYQRPQALQSKRPLANAETTKDADGAPPTPITVAASPAPSKPGTGTQEAPASSKINPTSSAMGAGPTPLSQVQKRPFSTGMRMQGAAAAAVPEPEPEPEPEEFQQPQRQQHQTPNPRAQGRSTTLGSPTLRLCLHGHPATWPVAQPEYPMTRKQFEEWIAEGDLISKGLLPRC
ncbi:hypothetical protein F4861DRAFT_548169 [Xylaria intraflava]|nr:hypothetical protein F4861DRAFT_548169 [Xylaria intraflava]